MHFFRITKEEQRSTSPPLTKEMKDNFHEWVEQDKDVAIPINLLLSEFYDSGQLFKSYVSDFRFLATIHWHIEFTSKSSLLSGIIVFLVDNRI